MMTASPPLPVLPLTLSLCGTLLACASTPASPPRAPDDATPAAAASASPAPSAAQPAEAPPSPAAQRPLDLTNACARAMHVYFGDQPGDGKGQAATVVGGAVVPVPRGPDGSVVVWVTDERGGPLADVHVTKRMRHVRIDASCMKIDADSER